MFENSIPGFPPTVPNTSADVFPSAVDPLGRSQSQMSSGAPASLGTMSLSPSNSDFWSQNSSGIEGIAQAGDLFGSNLAAGDFDNDGYQDLAIGVPGEDIDGIIGAGAVNVIYGEVGGLSSLTNEIWSQNSLGIEGIAEAGDSFGSSLVTGDFNNDGYDDLAIGVLGEKVDAITGAGAVNVIYGSAAGLTSTGDEIWHQDSPGIDGSAETGDRFGASLATGDFDNNGYDDLAIGVSGENVGASDNAGAVNVLRGSASGITATGNELWHQDVGTVDGAAEADDRFGGSLAAGDFNNDGYDDLAIGVSGENVGASYDAGAVNVLRGSSALLTDNNNELWHQDVGTVDGVAETNDRFGGSLAAGDFNNDGYDDLAIGVSGENVGASDDAGAVNVLRGSTALLTDNNNELWHQDVGTVEGVAEANDGFGRSLAAGDFNNDGYDDLAIGVSGEDVGASNSAGAVNVLRGSTALLTDNNNQLWSQDSAGQVAESFDFFGGSLAAGDFDNDGSDDLAIGVAYEDIGSIADAGGVNVLYS
ncbi:FG-GAP repeat protein [Microcoleus sp. Pol17_C1]|uniref:FG-GAP repeat protein n=2 Tax=Microcoleus TaxID=44471 RepID=UPI002FD16280